MKKSECNLEIPMSLLYYIINDYNLKSFCNEKEQALVKITGTK
jgi:hypothetical protein